MVRFIQTSDWQIGMKGGGLGEAASIVREIRLKSIHNVLKSAQEEDVDFILLCGDIFEHNMISQEDVKKVITIFNQYPDIPLYLLPGNHDILGADCIYNREIFQRINNLTILHTTDSFEVNGAILYPCPVFSKFTTQDLTRTIPVVKQTTGIHIGVAHGSLVGKFAASNMEDIDLPIDPACVDQTGIDYLALGHWHSYRTFEDCNGITRMAYSGTHEQTNYSEDNAGHCLLVQIDGKGEVPKIEPIKTGQLTWLSEEFEMQDSSSLNNLKNYLDTIKQIDMVKLVLYGELPLEHKENLDNLLEYETTRHENFRIKLDSLNITVPLQLEAPIDFGDPILNQTELHLKQLLTNETDPENKRIIVEALSQLQKFAKGVDA
jgi:DNA repair exonuclease SbcCD nuclease subunit